MAAKNALKVQVMMVGGRRCGKTSVLAAMKSNFEQQFAETDLTMSYADLETLSILEEKNNEIEEYFLGSDNRTFSPDSNPTAEMTTYSLEVGIKDKRDSMQVNFVDYPGEWLADKEHENLLFETMKKSQVLMIAIDTPHMMEEEGKYNERRNFCHRTGEMIKMALEKARPQRMLVLFVPLKCERYLKDNKINLMNELTKIKNVMKKVLPEAPNEVLLVLDGSTGQNAYEQAKQFTLATEVNALAITKLDGTAKGGVVIGISDQFKIPVKYIGIGEKIEDLQVFNREEFVDSLFS